jgi:hypothetical protein
VKAVMFPENLSAMYVAMRRGECVRTVELVPGEVVGDYAEDGTLLGVELLGGGMEITSTAGSSPLQEGMKSFWQGGIHNGVLWDAWNFDDTAFAKGFLRASDAARTIERQAARREFLSPKGECYEMRSNHEKPCSR